MKTSFKKNNGIILIAIPVAAFLSLFAPAALADNGNLSIISDVQFVYVGTPASVTFHVENMDSGEAINGAQVQLSGPATGSGTTGADGNAMISINADNPSTITATASKEGYNDASITIMVKAEPQLNLTADAQILYIGIPKNVVFTVNHVCGTSPYDTQCNGNPAPLVPTNGVTITLSGAATGSGTTGYDGNPSGGCKDANKRNLRCGRYCDRTQGWVSERHHNYTDRLPPCIFVHCG